MSTAIAERIRHARKTDKRFWRIRPEAWEDERGTVVVWGTHDPLAAHVAFSAYLTHEIGFELHSHDWIEAMPTREDFEKARQLWVNPGAYEVEEQWTKANGVRTRRSWWFGYVPVLVVIL